MDDLLEQLLSELATGEDGSLRNRRQEIPKDGRQVCGRARLRRSRNGWCKARFKLIVKPIFEADFQARSYGYAATAQSTHAAVYRVAEAIVGYRMPGPVIDVPPKQGL